jgi:hypothetical protein
MRVSPELALRYVAGEQDDKLAPFAFVVFGPYAAAKAFYRFFTERQTKAGSSAASL